MITFLLKMNDLRTHKRGFFVDFGQDDTLITTQDPKQAKRYFVTRAKILEIINGLNKIDRRLDVAFVDVPACLKDFIYQVKLDKDEKFQLIHKGKMIYDGNDPMFPGCNKMAEWHIVKSILVNKTYIIEVDSDVAL